VAATSGVVVLLALLALLLALSLPLVLVLLVAVILRGLPAHESPRRVPLLLQAPAIPLRTTEMPSVFSGASGGAS